MNKPLSDTELQTRMAEYNAMVVDKVVSLFERPGMPQPARPRCALSDEQYYLEIAAMKRLEAAVLEMELAIRQVNTDSGFRTINVTAWDEFRHDELPDPKRWQDRLDEVRAGNG